MTDPGLPTPPPSHPTAWGSNVGPPPSTPVTHATASTTAASAPPRKRWIVVLVGVCLLILGFAIGGTTLFFTNTLPPLEAAYDFTNDVERGDVDGALAQGCDQFRTELGRNFILFLRGDLMSLDVNPFGVHRDGDRATVEITIHRDVYDPRTFRMLFVNEAGDWRPCFPD